MARGWSSVFSLQGLISVGSCLSSLHVIPHLTTGRCCVRSLKARFSFISLRLFLPALPPSLLCNLHRYSFNDTLKGQQINLDFSELKAASLLWGHVLRHCTQTGSIRIWSALSWSSRSPSALCWEASLHGRPRDRELLLAQRVRESAWKLCVQGCCLWQMPPESQVASLDGCSPSPQDFDEPVHFRDPLKETLCWKLSLEVPNTTCDMQIWSFSSVSVLWQAKKGEQKILLLSLLACELSEEIFMSANCKATRETQSRL